MARFISRFNRAVLWMSLLVAVGGITGKAYGYYRGGTYGLDKLDELWPGSSVIVIGIAIALVIGSLFWFRRGGSSNERLKNWRNTGQVRGMRPKTALWVCLVCLIIGGICLLWLKL